MQKGRNAVEGGFFEGTSTILEFPDGRCLFSGLRADDRVSILCRQSVGAKRKRQPPL